MSVACAVAKSVSIKEHRPFGDVSCFVCDQEDASDFGRASLNYAALACQFLPELLASCPASRATQGVLLPLRMEGWQMEEAVAATVQRRSFDCR